MANPSVRDVTTWRNFRIITNIESTRKTKPNPNHMKPQELIEGLKNLAMQCPVEAVCFRVPSGPACTLNELRLDVSPRDILDMLDWVESIKGEVETHHQMEQL